MHNIKKYGSTYDRLRKIKSKQHVFLTKRYDQPDVILANTIFGFKKLRNKTQFNCSSR